MARRKRDIECSDFSWPSNGEPEPFNATSVIFARCKCGCGTLKLLALDGGDVCRAEVGFRPEQWLTIMREMTEECHAMLGAEGQC